MEIEKGKIYKHYKHGDLYKVLELAFMEDSNEIVVVYTAYEHDQQGKVWVRPMVEFEEKFTELW